MPNPFRVIAIISAFNEGDIISAVISHLVENGIDVYLMDNQSTDNTIEEARSWLGRGLIDIESFPGDSGSCCLFDWTEILRRKECLAHELSADWFIHHDADEIRESPWPGMTLKDSIRWVDICGYNCIDFKVLNFPPIDDGFKLGDDPRTYYRFYEEGAECDKVQLKCWKAGNMPVSLVAHGGHEARFEGRRIFPLQFLLRHYPIRGQKHGVRKVFAERRNRLLQAEKIQGWHRQYDQIESESHVFLKNPVELKPFDLDRARLELMLPETIIRQLGDRVVAEDKEISLLQLHRQELMKHASNLERERDELRQHANNLERARDELRQHANNLERARDELRQHANNLERARDELQSHAGNLERERNELREHANNLEKARDELSNHAGNLAQDRAAIREHVNKLEHERRELDEQITGLTAEREFMQKHTDELRRSIQDFDARHSALQRELEKMRGSRSWRWTAPLRRLRGMLDDLTRSRSR